MFEIGDKVEWFSGNIVARGLIYDDDGVSKTVTVNCIEIQNRKASLKVNVLRSLLIKIN